MRYINATQVLPPELLTAVQQYADGVFLYIPRKTDAKRPWGAGTATRAELTGRNRQIYREHLEGLTIQMLAERYFLSPKTIQRIITQMRREDD